MNESSFSIERQEHSREQVAPEVLKGNIQGNLRYPQKGLGIATYTLLGVQAAKGDFNEQLNTYFQSNLSDEQVKELVTLANSVHKSVNIVPKEDTSLTKNSKGDWEVGEKRVCELWEREKRGTYLFMQKVFNMMSEEEFAKYTVAQDQFSIEDIQLTQQQQTQLQTLLENTKELLESPEIRGILKQYKNLHRGTHRKRDDEEVRALTKQIHSQLQLIVQRLVRDEQVDPELGQNFMAAVAYIDQ